MFTIDQIKTAHSKVKSGADFPSYMQDMKGLGVTYYQTFVNDGHTKYHGNDAIEITSGPKYPSQAIADRYEAGQFKKNLLSHQQGGTDYLQFTRDCANNGVEKWAVCLESMTCTYYDKSGNEVMVEKIPG